MLFFPKLALGENIVCFTSSRRGGISREDYQSFNLGLHVGDCPQRVLTNRQLLNSILLQQVCKAGHIDKVIKPIHWMNQQHTNKAVSYEALCEYPTDATYTNRSFTPLAVMTADCLPIAISCGRSGKTAAIHAGWRGLVDDIIENTLTVFDEPEQLSVWIGPAISAKYFEVAGDVIEEFSRYPSAISAAMQVDKYHIDLIQIASLKLKSLGVNNVQVSPVCSYANENCFSHRRAVHQYQKTHKNDVNQHTPQTGKMATVIMRMGE